MRFIVTDGVSVAWSVCQDREHSCKMAEPIEMPFGLWSRVVPRNHVLDGVKISPWEGTILRGEGAAIVKYRAKGIPSIYGSDTLTTCFEYLKEYDVCFHFIIACSERQ